MSVVQGEHVQEAVRGAPLPSLQEAADLGGEVGVADHHPLGGPGGAASVEDHGGGGGGRDGRGHGAEAGACLHQVSDHAEAGD